MLIRLRRLICTFVVCIWHKQVFSWRGWVIFVCQTTKPLIRQFWCTGKSAFFLSGQKKCMSASGNMKFQKGMIGMDCFFLFFFILFKHLYGDNQACQLFPINSVSAYFRRHSHSPSLFCQNWPNLPTLRTSPYFFVEFLRFSFKWYKISKHRPHGNCQYFWSARSVA